LRFEDIDSGIPSHFLARFAKHLHEKNWKHRLSKPFSAELQMAALDRWNRKNRFCRTK